MTWGLALCSHLGLFHPLVSVDGERFEGIDRDEYGACSRVDVVARVPHAQIVQERALGELGHLCRDTSAEGGEEEEEGVGRDERRREEMRGLPLAP